jgi:hypothetical protein
LSEEEEASEEDEAPTRPNKRAANGVKKAPTAKAPRKAKKKVQAGDTNGNAVAANLENGFPTDSSLFSEPSFLPDLSHLLFTDDQPLFWIQTRH